MGIPPGIRRVTPPSKKSQEPQPRRDSSKQHTGKREGSGNDRKSGGTIRKGK